MVVVPPASPQTAAVEAQTTVVMATRPYRSHSKVSKVSDEREVYNQKREVRRTRSDCVYC